MGTHMQHAQVATVGHYLLGLIDRFDRDVARLLNAYATTNHCTLGCGALVGSSYPIDRDLVARLLGFDGIVENTNDCVGAGDYMLEAVSAVAGAMIGLSRLCQDLYTWHTQEFSYLTIGDDYSGSSSMMPQKKNPYPFEYARTAAAHIVGDMNGAFSALHNTNYQDIKDVEEGLPPPVFRACDTAAQMLELITGVMQTAQFDADTAYTQAATHFASCTELAARIHRESDLSMRTAHRVVGNLVLRAMKAGKTATEVGAETLNASAQEILGRDLPFDDDFVASALEPKRFIEAHDLVGGPAQRRVAESIARARESLARDQTRVRELRDALDGAHARLEEQVQAKVA
jgi:argininosuccinate lyase